MAKTSKTREKMLDRAKYEREEAKELLGDLTKDLSSIASHGKRADRIMRSMLMQARGQSGEFAMTNLNQLVEEAVKLAFHSERARRSPLRFSRRRSRSCCSSSALAGPREPRLLGVWQGGWWTLEPRCLFPTHWCRCSSTG